MRRSLFTACLLGLLPLAACAPAEPGRDVLFDSHKLSTMQATIWTDPNGCQHWIIDDNLEGYMSPRLDRSGRPVCPGRTAPMPPPQQITLDADALFDTDKATLRPAAVAELSAFGQAAQAAGTNRIFVEGHTDSRASDAYNMDLSLRRARSVADFLQQRYSLVAQVAGKGESEPVAPNTSAANMQANRRVEITTLN